MHQKEITKDFIELSAIFAFIEFCIVAFIYTFTSSLDPFIYLVVSIIGLLPTIPLVSFYKHSLEIELNIVAAITGSSVVLAITMVILQIMF